MKILIVEDERSFLLSNKMFLEQKGYEVLTAETGEDALKFFPEHTFDVILLDYMLPGISGLNVLQWMHEQKMETPVIMMTGQGSETVAVEAMKLGAYDYIRKELHDRHHLPVLINGVYERYLFRLDKQEQIQSESGRQKNRLILDMFHNATTSLAQTINNTLALLSLNIEEQSKALLPAVKDEEKAHFKTICEEMSRQYGLLSQGVRSLLMLAEAFREGLVGSKEAEEVQEIMSRSVRSLEEDHKRVSEDTKEF